MPSEAGRICVWYSLVDIQRDDGSLTEKLQMLNKI
jgi:hypothetical protein